MDVRRPPARSPLAVSDRLRTACDLWSAGVELQRQRLRRANPEASAAEIDRLVNRWLHDRPGAQRGDGPEPQSQ